MTQSEPDRTGHDQHDGEHHDPEEDVLEQAATVERDVLTGAPPNAEEIQRADPDRAGDETDPYELRSGVPTSPSDADPGSTLGR